MLIDAVVGSQFRVQLVGELYKEVFFFFQTNNAEITSGVLAGCQCSSKDDYSQSKISEALTCQQPMSVYSR